MAARGEVFLIGGGWTEAAFPETYGRFVDAARTHGPLRIACVLLDGEDRDESFARTVAAFASLGVADVYPVFVSSERPPTVTDFDGATGVLVCGGLTPGYRDAICPTADSWLPSLLDRGIPYAGFSAGAAIAADRSIIGGWKLRRGDADLVICAEDVSEDEEFLAVRPGLGLVPFAVDVHAAQWGTLARLLHAVNTGAVAEGWAIDEDTLLHVANVAIGVHGLGSAHHVRRTNGTLSVEIVSGGAPA